jgi:hypothetical protein
MKIYQLKPTKSLHDSRISRFSTVTLESPVTQIHWASANKVRHC